MSQVALELKNINTTVNIGTPEEKRILKDLNLTLEKGDFVTLLGTNGAGKSTLLNVINGSLNTTSGQVVLNNHDLTKLSEVKRAKYIAQVFQDPKMGTAPRMTVAENLLLATKRGQKRCRPPAHRRYRFSHNCPGLQKARSALTVPMVQNGGNAAPRRI